MDTVDPERVAAGVSRYACSGCVWDGGQRRNSSFLRSDWLFLDFDMPGITLEQAVENYFADSVHVIGTTKSHRKDKHGIVCDRFRVGLRLSETVFDERTYTATAKHYIDAYDADPACKDAARFFWPISVVSVVSDGYRTELVPPREEVVRTTSKVWRDNGIVRRRTVLALRSVMPENSRNNLCFQIAKDLCDAGFFFQEIFDMIASSPTYSGEMSRKLSEEISKCIRSGIKSVEEGHAYGRCDGYQDGSEEEKQGR